LAESDQVSAEATALPRPLRIVVRVKNNRLFSAREALGLSQLHLGKASGVAYGTVNKYENGKGIPMRSTGHWNESALKIAKFLRMLPEDLFPEAVLALKQTRFEREVSEADSQRLAEVKTFLLEPPPTPETIAAQLELRDDVATALGKLKPRLAQILRWRFAIDGPELTLDQVGDNLGLSQERTRQLEARAIQMLRHNCDVNLDEHHFESVQRPGNWTDGNPRPSYYDWVARLCRK